MKAIRFYAYGSPEVLKLEDLDMPVVGDDDVLVRKPVVQLLREWRLSCA